MHTAAAMPTCPATTTATEDPRALCREWDGGRVSWGCCSIAGGMDTLRVLSGNFLSYAFKRYSLGRWGGGGRAIQLLHSIPGCSSELLQRICAVDFSNEYGKRFTRNPDHVSPYPAQGRKATSVCRRHILTSTGELLSPRGPNTTAGISDRHLSRLAQHLLTTTTAMTPP